MAPNIVAARTGKSDRVPGERSHNLYLDGVRGVAVLAVLLTHGTFLLSSTRLTRYILPPIIFGWWGVDLFFVLSGFLITGILLSTRTAPNRASAFYARRVLRIFPIYYLCLAVLWIVSARSYWFGTMVPYTGAADRAAYLFYIQNWIPLWHSLTLKPNALGHFWSLAVEEQFYLIWPWIVWKLSPKAVLWTCVLGAVSALALRIALVSYFGPHLWIHCLTVTRGEGLLVGSALAVLNSGDRRINPRLLWGMAITGLAVIAAIVVLDPAEFSNTDAGPYMYTICISGLALVFGALVGGSQFRVPALTPALNAGWLRNVGKYSYGMYVYHIPLFYGIDHLIGKVSPFKGPLPNRYALAELLLLMAATYVTAFLSFVFIERPLLNLKRYFIAQVPRPAVPEQRSFVAGA